MRPFTNQVAACTNPAALGGGSAPLINGDVMANGQVNASGGLHLIDVNVAMGNLVDIVSKQAKAFKAR